MTVPDAPLISVIVCTYNRPDALRRALESVGYQKVEDIEILVVDDGSDHPVDSLIASTRGTRLIRTEHRGAGAARATGLQAARGQFIAYCDDDEWAPGHLHTQLKVLVEQEVDLVYDDSEWVQEGAAPWFGYSVDHDPTIFAAVNYIFASDVMHRAAPAREAGGFRPGELPGVRRPGPGEGPPSRGRHGAIPLPESVPPRHLHVRHIRRSHTPERDRRARPRLPGRVFPRRGGTTPDDEHLGGSGASHH